MRRVEIREKPEVLWETAGLAGFDLRGFDEQELEERRSAMQANLDRITRIGEGPRRLEGSRRSLPAR